MIATVAVLLIVGWCALCLSALVGKCDELVGVLRRLAAAVESQNTHYGIIESAPEDSAG